MEVGTRLLVPPKVIRDSGEALQSNVYVMYEYCKRSQHCLGAWCMWRHMLFEGLSVLQVQTAAHNSVGYQSRTLSYSIRGCTEVYCNSVSWRSVSIGFNRVSTARMLHGISLLFASPTSVLVVVTELVFTSTW